MKIKRLILVTMALASSVFTIGAALYHQSVKNERVKIEILEGDLKSLEDEKLVFFNHNGLSTENIVEVSKIGLESFTKSYNDLNYIYLNNQSDYNSRGFITDDFKKNHNELYKAMDDLGKRKYFVDYKFGVNSESPYIAYILTNNDTNPDNFTFKLVHYNKDNVFEEKSIELKGSDFYRENFGSAFSMKLMSIYKESDSLLKIVAKTNIQSTSSIDKGESSFNVYDYIEIDLSSGKYKSQNMDLYNIDSASIVGNNLYVLGHPGNDEVIRKFDINNFSKTKDIYSSEEMIKANAKEGIFSKYSERYLNIFDNRFESLDLYETDNGGALNLTTVNVATSEIKEYEAIPVMTKTEIAVSNIINAFTSKDKLYISYSNEDIHKYIDGKSFVKVVDLNTGKTLLKLRVNTGSNIVSRVIE